MKKSYTKGFAPLVVIIIIVALAAGGVLNYFSDSVKICQPAYATIKDARPFYIERVDGYDNKSSTCDISLEYTDDSFPSIDGKCMTCKIPDSELSNFKSYLRGQTMLDSCTGPLIDYLIEVGAK